MKRIIQIYSCVFALSIVLLPSSLNAMNWLGEGLNAAFDAAKQIEWGKRFGDAAEFVGTGIKKTAEVARDGVIDVGEAWSDYLKDRARDLEIAYQQQLATADDAIRAVERRPNATAEEIQAAYANKQRIIAKRDEEIGQMRKGLNEAVGQMGKAVGGIAEQLGETVKDARELAKASWMASIERDKAVAIEKERSNTVAKGIQTAVENVTKAIKENPHYIIGIPVATFAISYTLYHVIKYTSERWRIPSIAQETSLLSTRDRFSNWLYGVKYESDLTDVKFSPELTEQLTESAIGLKMMIENGSILQNKLFYGPPGTGKTEFAMRLARWSGMDYIYFSAGQLEKLSIEEATRQVAELFTYAQFAAKPLMIVVDEADLVFGDRGKMYNGGGSALNEKRFAVNNQFLTYTGKGSSHYMVIAITNHPEQFDSAFLSRCDEQILIGPPNAQTRREILDHYIDKYLVRGDHLPLPENQTGFAKVMSFVFPGSSVVSKVNIAEDALSDKARDDIALQLDGWVGRDIEQLVTLIETIARTTESREVTPAVIKKAMTRKTAEKRKQQSGFAFSS